MFPALRFLKFHFENLNLPEWERGNRQVSPVWFFHSEVQTEKAVVMVLINQSNVK